MKGILFKPWKIKAIADGSPDKEWQTRRLSGLKEINQEPKKWEIEILSGNDGAVLFCAKDCEEGIEVKPRYQVGDIVYIKETWTIEPENRNKLPIPENEIVKVKYYNGEVQRRWGDIFLNDKGIWLPSVAKSYKTGKWQSPMFLPVKLARYFIQITDVRPERLQSITAEDAVKEGCWVGLSNAKVWYKSLWNSINKANPWEGNPFVWVYSFKPVDPKKI